MNIQGLTIDPEEVSQIADRIKEQNNKLDAVLRECEDLVKQLNTRNVWEGKAAQETVGAFQKFANKYFDNYRDVIDRYVQFLKVNVSQGFTEKENQNTAYAQSFE